MFPALHCFGIGIWCLTPLTTIILVQEAGVPGENHRPTYQPKVTDKLYHIMLYRVHFA